MHIANSGERFARTVGRLASILVLCVVPARAANECKVEYGFHTGGVLDRLDQRKTIYLNSGEIRAINQLQMNYVKNLQDRKVQVTLQGALINSLSLNRNQADPPLGFYLTPVTLKSLQCLTSSSDAAAGSPEQLIASLEQAGRSATEIARALKSTFNLGAGQIASLLKAAGFAAADIAAALQSSFGASVATIAGWLKAAGYSGLQTVAALRSGIRAAATDAASAVKGAYGATADQFSKWAESCGYSGQDAATAFERVFNLTAEQSGLLLRRDYAATASLLAQWLHDAGHAAADCARALEGHGFTPEQILEAYRVGLDANSDLCVRYQKTLQTIITNVNCTRTSCRQPADRMRAAGFPAVDTLRALRVHFSVQIRAADEIARYAFGLTLSSADQALAAAGYSAAEIAGIR